MPKKRHHVQYSKPQSTAPASLSSSRGSSSHDGHSGRGVNELLADLRRVSLRSHQPTDSQSVAGAPTVPPAIRRILQLPEHPPPAPRRPIRVGPNGRRLPPGPAPPRSWLSAPAHAPPQHVSGAGVVENFQRHGLPGAYLPARSSLTDLALRKLTIDWEFQRSYNRYYLYGLPCQLKVALITYLGMCYSGGVSLADLRAILLPSPEVFEDGEADGGDPLPSPSSANEYIFHLDLTGSPGRSIKLRELSDLLFPSAPPAAGQAIDLQESWDAAPFDPGGVQRPLLPNLTHLSLAVAPQTSPSAVSWRQLLSLASHLPTLTHLSLAYWPEPSLTPNARLAGSVVVDPGGRSGSGRIPYGGTGPYSHSLDGDWSEAVVLLRRLAKNLYGLECLDLTGCAPWFPALMAAEPGCDAVDWVGDWGKVGRLLLHPGFRLGEGAGRAERERFVEAVEVAGRVERHIRARRAGRGRWIAVETDALPGDA